MWAVVVYYSLTQMMARSKITVVIYSMLIVIYVLDEMSDSIRESRKFDVSILAFCGTITAITGSYLYVEFEALIFERTGFAFHHEYVLALLFTLVMFYLIQRSFGWLFLSVIIFGTGYAVFGAQAPGVLRHGGVSLSRTLGIFVLNFDGFFGSIAAIVAVWVTIFMLYAGLLRGYGAFDYIMRLAFRVSGTLKSGVAQAAVVSSLLIGSITGGQTTNAAMTGSMTIPLMKESGLRDSTAGAIEAVASSGGQIMPPVMGAAAFVMASILGISYFDVVVFGIFPAFIFYIAVALAVHYKAIGQGIDLDDSQGDMEADLNPIPSLIFYLRTIKYGVPLLILIFTLGYLRYTVPTSALYASIAMALTGTLFPVLESFLGHGEISPRNMVSETVEGLRYGAILFAPIGIISMGINAIIDIFNVTGIPGMLALTIMDFSGGVLITALLLAMLICIALGLGMPTVASYTLVAMLVAPTLVESFALQDITVHYFVLYGAILSGLTPPIAIAVVVTTSIAGSNFWRTAYESLKIAAPLYILPFTFIYTPEIFIADSLVVRLASGLVLLAGTLMITHALNYHNRISDSMLVSYGFRLIVTIAGIITMVSPMLSVRIGAFIGGLLVIGLQVIYLEGRGVSRFIPAATGSLFK
jgi:TRAP transporter 4TM/12TM fusion protein